MAAVAHELPLARRRHQQVVATLLDMIEQRRQRVYALQAIGMRPAGMRELKAELRALRRELAAVVGR
ncbi:MAG TPA: hypothetical protein VGF23_06740 [Gaiellaceae bacterium]|jgi:hypothetical protein